MAVKLDSGAVLTPSGFVEGSEYKRGVKPERGGPMYHVSVSKRGGGTVGREYDGEWDVWVMLNGQPIVDGEILRDNAPRKHWDIAQTAVEFATADRD